MLVHCIVGNKTEEKPTTPSKPKPPVKEEPKEETKNAPEPEPQALQEGAHPDAQAPAEDAAPSGEETQGAEEPADLEPVDDGGNADSASDSDHEPVAEQSFAEYVNAALPAVKPKAPLKSEINSAKKLIEKGWICVPVRHDGMDPKDILTKMHILQMTLAGYADQLALECSKGSFTEEDKEAYRQEGRQEILNKIAKL